MAKSVKRSESRKKKLTIRRKNRDRRDRRTRRNRSRKGGEAPVNYSLSGDWSSRMSLGQGADGEADGNNIKAKSIKLRL